MENIFNELRKIDLKEYIEKKDGLSYVSWPNAWSEVKRICPEASYTIWKDENGRPYVYDELTGFMVYTTVTIQGITHEMWLPVMDGKNKAMKAVPYTYKTKYGDKTVEAATMFDINKTIMRCLVKNLAMFGLGLYIYAGEDLPEGEEPQKPEPKKEEAKPEPKEGLSEVKIKAIQSKCKNEHVDQDKILQMHKITEWGQMSDKQYAAMITNWEKVKATCGF